MKVAKTNSPVMIAGNDLDKSQIDLVNSKSFKTITQVGGNGNESAFDEIKDIQNGAITSKPEQKPEVQEPGVQEQVPSKPEQKPETPGQVPSNPSGNSNTEESEPVTPEQITLYSSREGENADGLGDTTYEALQKLSDKWKLDSEGTLSAYNGKIKFENLNSNTEESEPVTPEQITLYSSREGENADGLGDTTYEALQKLSDKWKLDSEGTLSAYNGKIKFENLNGNDNLDAKLTIKNGSKEMDKEVLNVLTLMNGKEESQFKPDQLYSAILNGSATIKDGSRYIDIKYDVKYTGDIFPTITVKEESQFKPDQLYSAILNGSATIKDGSRYIDIKYDVKYTGDIFPTITVIFSNFGITPLHDITEGDNGRGFGDTTYDELRNSSWIAVGSSKNQVRSNKGNVSFTKVGGAKSNDLEDIDGIIEMEGDFDNNNEDLLYSLSLMLNSRIEADKLANKIKEGYDKGTTKMIKSYRNSVIIVDINNKNKSENKSQDKSSVKITFKNVCKDLVNPSL